MTKNLNPRLIAQMEASNQCAQLVLSAVAKGALDAKDCTDILSRLSVIDARSMLLIACMNIDEIEADFTKISLTDEIRFMDGADVFIKHIQELVEGACGS